MFVVFCYCTFIAVWNRSSARWNILVWKLSRFSNAGRIVLTSYIRVHTLPPFLSTDPLAQLPHLAVAYHLENKSERFKL